MTNLQTWLLIALTLGIGVGCRGRSSSTPDGPTLPGYMLGSDMLALGMSREQVVDIFGKEPVEVWGAGNEKYELGGATPGSVVVSFEGGVLVYASFGPSFTKDVAAPRIDKKRARFLTEGPFTTRAIKGEVTMTELVKEANGPGLRVFWKISKPSRWLPGDPLVAEETHTWAWLVDEVGRDPPRAVYVSEVGGMAEQPGLRDFPPRQ